MQANKKSAVFHNISVWVLFYMLPISIANGLRLSREGEPHLDTSASPSSLPRFLINSVTAAIGPPLDDTILSQMAARHPLSTATSCT